VYDCTPFLRDHPGGAESILINAGTDCTEEFDAIHSRKAKGMLKDYLIGEADLDATEPDSHSAAAASQEQVVPSLPATGTFLVAAGAAAPGVVPVAAGVPAGVPAAVSASVAVAVVGGGLRQWLLG